MNKSLDPQTLETVAQAFDSDFVIIPIASILPVKAIEKTVKSSHKYRQILASIREVGLVEPPAVIRDSRDPGSYLLLDGHLRIEVLRDLGTTEVECLISTDDEASCLTVSVKKPSGCSRTRSARWLYSTFCVK